MNKYWDIIYNLFGLPVFRLAIFFLGLFNKNINRGLECRKDLIQKLEKDITDLDQNKLNILIQCSSLGELEQAKPIVQELDKKGIYNFIFSFFSPSGYENSKFNFISNSRYIKTYLPLDTISNVRKFLTLVKPKTVIFIKYDLWYNLLNEIKKNKIFSILVNVTYNEKSFKYRIPIIKNFFRKLYSFFDFIFVIDKENKYKLSDFLGGDKKIIVSGDTKIERINEAVENNKQKNIFNENIIKNKTVFVVGSSWENDIEIILPVLDKLHSNGSTDNFLTVIVPHEPTKENISDIENKINHDFDYLNSIRYSDIINYNQEKIIIVDCIGLLLTIYKYADIAYVGGSYNAGLHNVMEPARFCIPVLFGDDKISDDAEYLMEKGIGIKVSDKKDIYYNIIKVQKDKFSDMSREVNAIFLNGFKTSTRIADLINKQISNV